MQMRIARFMGCTPLAMVPFYRGITSALSAVDLRRIFLFFYFVNCERVKKLESAFYSCILVG